MTNEELQAATARLTEVDTEVAALDQTIRDQIDKAREFNEARRITAGKRTILLKTVEPLRAAVQEHIIQAKREQSERIKAAAEARAAAEAAAPKQPTPAELMAKIVSLEEQLAAKG